MDTNSLDPVMSMSQFRTQAEVRTYRYRTSTTPDKAQLHTNHLGTQSRNTHSILDDDFISGSDPNQATISIKENNLHIKGSDFKDLIYENHGYSSVW